MSHLRRVADYWSRLAKQQGYPARSVFKLKEIDHKYHIFRAGDRVCDLGCSPGSWTMFAAERVGPAGMVLGLDTHPLPLTVPLPPHVTIMQQDVFEWHMHPSFHRSFDVLLSDMAPNTTGIKILDANSSHALCQQAIDISHKLLKPNGTFVMKIFHGAGFGEILSQVQSSFGVTHTIKPVSTRFDSVETFIVAKRKKFVPLTKTETSAVNIGVGMKMANVATRKKATPTTSTTLTPTTPKA